MTTPDIPSETIARLMEAAIEASKRAYVPYSDFPVGAALLTESGDIVPGCNVENASYPLSVCAERVAVTNAVAAGHRTVIAIAVTAPKVPAVTPCGGCRQVLNEFKPRDGDMIVALGGGDAISQTTLSALLPNAFGPADLDSAALDG